MSDINMDALLDGTLDDLADLPEFKPFPNGAHKCLIKFERKEINKHPSIEVTLTAKETLELANPADDVPLVAGTTTNVAYMMDNEIGQGRFKELMKPFAEATPGVSLGKLMEAYQNAEVNVVTEKRANKEKTKEYTDIKMLALA